MRTFDPTTRTVMAALEAAIQSPSGGEAKRLWMAGSSPAMTNGGKRK